MRVAAILSMLHEPAEVNSATRAFFDQPVLTWTLRRLSLSTHLQPSIIVCWADQAESVRAAGAEPSIVGPRLDMPSLNAIAIARKWSDGWRGGLLGSCEFDLGFDGRVFASIAEKRGLEAIVLINPAAAGIDPELVDRTIEHTTEHSAIEYAFVPAAPGFGLMLLRASLLARLADANASPGQLISYRPDAPIREPLGSESCVEAPLPIVRSTRRFTLDCQHQVDVLSAAWADYRDRLDTARAEQLCSAARSIPVDRLPRDLTLEITTRRLCRPIFSPASKHAINRPDLPLELAQPLFEELAERDDSRLTLAGIGDPALHPRFAQMTALARRSGVQAIHVETDLLTDDPAMLAPLVENVDVLSIHLPAMTAKTYAAVMGQDRLDQVMQNLTRLVTLRQARGRLPILVPTFVKTRQNLAEMEAWYDQWLRALGSAAIVAPGDFGGMTEGVSIGDMAPPARVPCRRIGSRAMVLCDGSIVSCEEDLLGQRRLGTLGIDSLAAAWTGPFAGLRALHADRKWNECGPCAACREWHRP